MATRPTSVFVIDVPEQGAFAFEAKSAAKATIMVRKRWFVRAFDEFYARRRLERSDRPLLTRLATPAEAALYAERVSEFPEALGFLLITQLSD